MQRGRKGRMGRGDHGCAVLIVRWTNSRDMQVLMNVSERKDLALSLRVEDDDDDEDEDEDEADARVVAGPTSPKGDRL